LILRHEFSFAIGCHFLYLGRTSLRLNAMPPNQSLRENELMMTSLLNHHFSPLL